ncbi:MAPEG family protein [Magnetovibrio sp.]|uniref:MAPEG family protein n=1 Tax=Magnetovibrio sp. TaxID=2024836 RepID=UPI002F94966D
MLTITPIYAALNIMLAVGLTYVVVHHRIQNQVPLGDGGHTELGRAIRAHGNLSENAPFALLLLALVEWNGLPAWQLHALGAAFTVARLAHIYGIMNAAIAPRSMGALFTTIILTVLSGLAVVQVLLA